MSKSKYTKWLKDENLEQLINWKKSGLSERQIAQNMGISLSSLAKYKNEHKDIADALELGAACADQQVENALFKRATGCSIEETKTTTIEKGKTSEIRTVKSVKHIPPDTTACIFWLTNKRKEVWRKHREEPQQEVKPNKLSVLPSIPNIKIK